MMHKDVCLRETWLRAVEFRSPAWIPCEIKVQPQALIHYRALFVKLVERHPMLFPTMTPESVAAAEIPPSKRRGFHTDNWDAVWRVAEDGVTGHVVRPPLADWNAFEHFTPPDPQMRSDEYGPMDSATLKQRVSDAKSRGLPVNVRAGRLFDRLYILRGFENLMVDIASDEPRLQELIDILTDHMLTVSGNLVAAGVDAVRFHSDIATQSDLMISPQAFRRHIKPMFAAIFKSVRASGALVDFSSDGNLLKIVDDLVECGVSIHDPQIRANTMQAIERVYKGKLCINLDLDRQAFPTCTPHDIEVEIRNAVRRLALPEGGLMVFAYIGGTDIPPDNIRAICRNMEDYCLA